MKYNFSDVTVERLDSLSEMQFPELGQPNEVMHDDGTLHITYNGIRYCFDIGQDVSLRVYNHNANLILRDVGITGPKVTGNNN